MPLNLFALADYVYVYRKEWSTPDHALALDLTIDQAVPHLVARKRHPNSRELSVLAFIRA